MGTGGQACTRSDDHRLYRLWRCCSPTSRRAKLTAPVRPGRQIGFCAALLLAANGIGCSTHPSDKSVSPVDAASEMNPVSVTDAGRDAEDAACPASSESNTVRVVESAISQPPWVEMTVSIMLEDPVFDFTRFQGADDATRAQLIMERMDQLAPVQDDIEARLLTIGARQPVRFWLSASVAAVVPARHIPEIPCWPSVAALSPDGVACVPEEIVNGVCLDPCLVKTTCDNSCRVMTGDCLDIAHQCTHRSEPVACTSAGRTASGELTCYVRKGTGDIFAVADAWLVDTGDTELRKCTRSEGGSVSPVEWPACP